LFQFHLGNKFPGLTFYAVTPDFIEKCKKLLLAKEIWSYDYDRFDKLPAFEMNLLGEEELYNLATKIMDVHGVAFKWNPYLSLNKADLKFVVKEAASVQVCNRVRRTIREVIKFLDRLLEDEKSENQISLNDNTHKLQQGLVL